MFCNRYHRQRKEYFLHKTKSCFTSLICTKQKKDYQCLHTLAESSFFRVDVVVVVLEGDVDFNVVVRADTKGLSVADFGLVAVVRAAVAVDASLLAVDDAEVGVRVFVIVDVAVAGLAVVLCNR